MPRAKAPRGTQLTETVREPVPLDKTAEDMARSGRLTPMLRQYLEIKRAHPECMVLFRLGDFYEIFFEDAVLASQILDLTLTARGKGPDRYAMAGVPHHSAKSYIGRLVEAGQRVAIVEQVEEPGAGDGIVRREVSRILTPGMIIDDEVLEPRSERLVGALVLAQRGGALALLDVSTGAFRACRVEEDEALAEELARAAPRELLVSEAVEDSRLEAVLARLPNVFLSRREADLFGARVGRAALKEALGASALEGYGIPQGGEGDLLAGAAGALLRYVSETQRAAAAHVDSLFVYHPGQYLVLDESTRANLEVTRSLRGGRRKGSLLDCLDATVTAMGGRLLARWLTWPLKERAAIEARQAAVASLVEAGAARSEVRAALAPAADLERLLARLSLGQGNARDLRALARTLTVAPAVAAALAKAAGEAGGLPERLEALSAALHGFEALATKLDGALVDEPPATVREGGLFRPGYDPRLDEVLALSTDGKRTLLELEQRERARTGIPSLKIRFNKIFGYYIEVTHAHREKVPPEYERRQTMKGSERYVTPELKAWEEKVLGAEERRKALEYELFEALRQEVVAEASRLRRLAAALAEIDVLAALAHTAAQRGWCRPVLDESRELQIEAGRHPVVEAALEASGGEPFVPNDVRLDEDAFLMILTGPNMAGKSTVMRQVALIALLAHVGSYVPARSCRLGLCDRIFTRVGASDDLARGQSTFMVEMTETARILNHATDRSLVILDEIGRGTSTWDGVSIAWAVAEHIHDHLRCRTLFATHYHELTDLAKERSGVVNYTVAVREWEGQIVFLRRLVPGAANRSYGIQVARLAGLPRAVLDRAAEVLANLEAGELDEVGRPALAHHRGEPPGKGQLTLFSVPRRESEAERLIAETDPDGLSPREALDLLYRLKALL